MAKLNILYEDNHLIAVYKPAGLLVQGDKTGDPTLMDAVKEYLKKEYKKPGNVFLGLVHRLDRPVSGIVLFAKTSKGASRISEQFRNREVTKIYTAVVVGEFEPRNGVLRDYLTKNEESKTAEVSENGKESELYYETVKTNNKFSLLRLEPSTGRFHQIRVQLSLVGHPIVGDLKYLPAGRQAEHSKGGSLKNHSIALCATGLEFKTATTDEIKKIEVPYPQEWNSLFNKNSAKAE